MSKPILSIGIIFKNEIRCLERCVKSLQPLRDAIPCELVMADTGADDGSREVAEKYADILIDFPWINDFAAARNAVMDRCSGEWYFSIDADEWLDENVEELVAFFKGDEHKNRDACAMMEWNLFGYDIESGHSTFMPWRMIRMATGMRYEGAIHEHWDLPAVGSKLVLCKTLLYHDGYVEMGKNSGKKKRERNLTLLRENLKKDPDNLLNLLQFIESGGLESDFAAQLRHAVEMVQKKAKAWNTLGPSILRYAVTSARAQKLPEMEEWAHMAGEWFPESYFIRIDAAFEITAYYLEAKKYDECIHWGEFGLKGYADYRENKGDIACQMYGPLQLSTPKHECGLKMVLARGYFEAGRQDDAVKMLSEIDATLLDKQWITNVLETFQMFQHRSELDLSSLITTFWEQSNAPVPNEDWAKTRRSAFVQLGAVSFSRNYREREEKSEGFCRHVYRLYKPLAGTCILGDAAAILDSEEAVEIATLLHKVENLDELPPSSLAHALKAGVRFPDRPLSVNKMDGLINRLAQDKKELLEVIECVGRVSDLQLLTWVRGLLLAAVKVCDWKDEEKGMELARKFAVVERQFVSFCYTPELLRAENLFVLPPMHRFGWQCAQAFGALDNGDVRGYIRHLREGLSTCESMKAMVEFLLKHTPEIQTPAPSQELQELADKVRAMLSTYDPADPAVAAIKQSPVYQKVAYLIEGVEAPVLGGLAQ